MSRWDVLLRIAVAACRRNACLSFSLSLCACGLRIDQCIRQIGINGLVLQSQKTQRVSKQAGGAVPDNKHTHIFKKSWFSLLIVLSSCLLFDAVPHADSIQRQRTNKETPCKATSDTSPSSSYYVNNDYVRSLLKMTKRTSVTRGLGRCFVTKAFSYLSPVHTKFQLGCRARWKQIVQLKRGTGGGGGGGCGQQAVPTNLSVLSRASSPNDKVPRNWRAGQRCCLSRTMTCRISSN